MFIFNGESLQNRLAAISPPCRRIFALSCAERLFPLYQLFSRRVVHAAPNLLHSTLDHLWELTFRGEATNQEPFLSKYESLIPGENAEWTPLNPLVENAVAALAYACLSSEAENARWAAVQSYEAVDYIAHTLERIDFGGAETETTILDSEYVQGEINRQLRDITELELIFNENKGIETVVNTFRNRAKSEGELLVPVAARL